MKTESRILVFKQVRSVEKSQSVRVRRKVGRNPVQDHTDSCLMKGIDEKHQILRAPIATGGRKVAGTLIAPRAVKRMLLQRQKLYVREAHFDDMLDEKWRNLTIA